MGEWLVLAVAGGALGFSLAAALITWETGRRIRKAMEQAEATLARLEREQRTGEEPV